MAAIADMVVKQRKAEAYLMLPAPGQGKFYTAGIAHPEAFEVDKLWYCCCRTQIHQYSMNYVDLPVRTALECDGIKTIHPAGS